MKIYLKFLALILSSVAFPQEYSLTNYGIEDGLPSATVFEIFQSSQQYLWLGTENNGVCRFDGYTYKIYNSENGLSGNTVRSIIEDNKNRLWFATNNGITIYDGLNFTIIDKKNGLTDNAVVSLYLDSKNNVWAGVAGEEGGINKIQFIEDSVYVENYLTKNILNKNAVFTIVEDTLGTIWAGTFGGGVFYTKKQNDSLLFAPFNKSDILSNYILCSTIDEFGKLGFGTYDAGIFMLEPNAEPDKSEVSVIPVLYESNIKRIWDIKAEKNEILLASNDHGLVRYSKNNIIRLNDKNGLPGNQILKIFRDNNRNLWISNYDKGISMFNSENIYRVTSKLSALKYNVLHVKKQGRYLWLGTNRHGLIRYDLIKNIFIEFNSSNSMLTDYISSIDIDKDNNIWVGSNKGVFKIFGDKLINISVKDGLVNKEVNSVLVASDNSVWCATKEGVSKINGTEIANSSTKTGLINNEVITLFEDSQKNVWVGTYGGLAMFTPEGILYNFDKAEGLMELRIQSLAENSNGDLLIGTAGGGIYISTKDGNNYSFDYFQPSDLLISKNISFIECSDNQIVVGTDKGISKLIVKANKPLKVYSYNRHTGFQGNECNFNASVLTDNTLFVGAINGIYLLDNILEIQPENSIHVNVTNVKLFYKDVDWSTFNIETELWNNAPKNLELDYKNKNLTFEFNAIQFKNAKAIEYACRIKELDNFWPPFTKDRYKQYSDFHPGKYTLQIKAKYNNTESDICEYKFEINPPFWNTWLFNIGVIVFVILLFLLILNQREKNLKKEKIRLDGLVNDRTKEVVEQKEVIEEKSKEIVDSIKYAKNIQNALLPAEESLSKFLQDYFILFKPRDIVSGDFYWYTMQEGKLIVVAADCTGHGVPGAFMSMLGISFLNEIVNEKKVFEPADILNLLRQNVIKALKQQGELGESADGMDISLIVFEPDKKKCTFAGGNNDLFIIRGEDFMVIKADRMPIAYYPIMNDFTQQEVELQENDILYVFSDGYMDQMGGPKGKRIMKSKFKKLLSEKSYLACNEQKLFLDEFFEDWAKDEEQLDDVLVIGLKV